MENKKAFKIISVILLILCFLFCYNRMSSHNNYKEEEDAGHWAATPTVRYQNELYFATSSLGKIEPKEWIVVGSIESICSPFQIPTENNQTNYGTIKGDLCSHPSKPGFLIILYEDNTYSCFKKEVLE